MFNIIWSIIVIAIFLATVCYYELRVMNLEVELAVATGVAGEPPFNLVTYDKGVLEAMAFEERVMQRNPYQRSTAYEQELMADINSGNVVPFAKSEIEKYN